MTTMDAPSSGQQPGEELVFKIFWPMHLCKPLNESGYLVGWNLGTAGIVVASKASYANAAQVSTYLSEFHQSLSSDPDSTDPTSPPAARGICDRRFWTQLDHPPPLPPCIVGYLSREGEGLCEPDARDSSYIWIEAFTARKQVAFRSIQSFGTAVPARIILFLYEESVGEPWHFYSASPIILDLTTLLAGDCHEYAAVPGDHSGPTLQRVLDHTNAAGQVYAHLEGGIGVVNADETSGLRKLICDTLFTDPAAHTLGQVRESASAAAARLCGSLLVLSTYLLNALELNLLGARFKDLSAVGQQLNLIVRRASYLIEQWNASYYTRRPVHGARRHNAQFVSFWNSAWVIALDLLIGCFLGIYLVVYSQWVSEFVVTNLRLHTVTSLEQTIDWLRKWPAGLKLNNGLDGFLAELFLWLIHFWTVIFQPFTKCLRAVVIIAGWSGFLGGCSMQLAILSDTLALTTLHTYWFYIVATRIFHWQLVTLYSLFNLFRGRKHNVLRNRIDNCDYDLDQLLIGTILFTLLTYLFPTVLVYYVMFVSRRLVVIMAQGLLEILLGILNHCPIFYFFLRLRDPRMFPGGVSYDVNSKYSRRFIEAAWDLPGAPVRLSRDPIPLSARNRINVTVVQMDQVAMPFSAIFFQYYHIWAQFSASYLSLSLLRSLVLGNVVRPVPRLQHSMIPGLSSTSNLLAEGAEFEQRPNGTSRAKN
ncbi:pig-Q [Kickxella alabastrina]|nr:pig-Q [Kickxella alabastrina]